MINSAGACPRQFKPPIAPTAGNRNARRASIPVPGSVSAPVIFASAQKTAIVATLNGVLLGVSCSGSDCEAVLWQIETGKPPLFCGPLPFSAPSRGSKAAHAYVAAVHVAGGLTCMCLPASSDAPSWEHLAWPAGVPLVGVYQAACWAENGAVAVLGDERGCLALLRIAKEAAREDGPSSHDWRELVPSRASVPRLPSWELCRLMDFGDRITGLARCGNHSASCDPILLAVTLASGIVALVTVRTTSDGPSAGVRASVRASVRLPAPCFTGPCWDDAGSRILVGCRDDHVYCLAGWTEESGGNQDAMPEAPVCP